VSNHLEENDIELS